jgi:hypothetical protein
VGYEAANHVDKPVERLQAAGQIIVLAVVPREATREIIEVNSFQAFCPF